MKIYLDRMSTTSRPILLFLAEHPAAVEIVEVDLMADEHQRPAFAALNPNQAVPVLVDGDFRLTEVSAILKLLAEDTPAYPAQPRARARVNQAMDWFNTGFYREFGYGLVYPQTFPHHRHANPATQADVLARGRAGAARWLAILNDHMLAGQPYLCGETPTIADYLGAAYVSIGDWIGYDLAVYPRVARWMRTMRARPSWSETHEKWDGVTAFFRSPQAVPA
jgi:glutathione S-transferase